MSGARALVLTAPRTFELRSLPVPDAGDGGVLRVEACGLCGTDHEQYSGHLFPGFPFVPGHEVVGVVESASEQALERWGVDLGQRVAVEVFLSCRECDACRRGEYRRCERHGMADMIGFLPVDRPPGLWGGYATHLYLQPDALLLPVPDGVDAVLATAFNPLGAGVRWGRTVPGTAEIPRMPGPSTATTSPSAVPGTVLPQRTPAPNGLNAVARTASTPSGTGSSSASGCR